MSGVVGGIMSWSKEFSEHVDYGFVINAQLNRIAEARSKLCGVEGCPSVASYSVEALNVYYHHVSTLYAILLPELRGDAGMYLEAVARIDYLKRGKPSDEVSKELNEIKEKLGTLNVLELIDKALEVMLVRLSEAGLLMRSRSVKVGVVR